MKLYDILKNVDFINNFDDFKNIEISDIVYESWKVKKDCIFVCLRGKKSDGHKYIQEALNKNCVVIVAEEKNLNVKNLVIVKNTRKALAIMSCNFFENPASKLVTIGVTGTKGKTTVTCMIKNILEASSEKVGTIGTLGACIKNEIIELKNTTPESYEVQKYLKYMLDKKCRYAVIEASSLGLKNHRLDGFVFDYGIFTNFSSDHIGENEHENMQDYLESKSLLFKKCKIGFFNQDDENFTNIIKNHICKIKTFGFSDNCDIYCKNTDLISKNGNIGIKSDFLGNTNINLEIFIPGKFSVYNALAAVSVCCDIKIMKKHIIFGIKNTKVKGRVEILDVSDKFVLLIDYAHNALSMKNILETLREYKPKRLVNMFGSGGNRPKVRRYEMGEISGNLADLSIITTDNPRFENISNIIEDIKIGINKTNGKYIVIPDRKEAIRYCIENAKEGDIVVLAGKGHETYQEINGVKYDFDERVVVKNIIGSK
ncbi:MAG: UDP-N-acetylmuramoyl-L-alanyl-D-glutamate--2,6-diaminopimelate ligase [Candidatus Paraimprobicoccus trichonymphae]|uniref:UDP-N-acetylmuramoyl-L-alanyl-D-glutamate--2,6-diaminopimelate ligase n=1 Tax=Candidatus Paraimprobicoccus trichonymphae TaxID=3033793 RepID=A0AA48I987_9FIRM|nr:MAG: UDP-N-acetylmuramoyl-L-alanyl-D-glutamate--2,6-diaminopimelate ligase [Candidatus Paraimprobicoccus trichonymphae]